MNKILLTLLIIISSLNIGCDNGSNSQVDDNSIANDDIQVIKDYDQSNLEIPEGMVFGKAIKIKDDTVVFFTEPGVKESEIIPDGLVINGIKISNPYDKSNTALPIATKTISSGYVMRSVERMKATTSGITPERSFELPADCILTGLGAGVRDSNFRDIEVNYTELKYDPTTGDLTFVKKGRIRIVSTGYGIEKYTQINTNITDIVKDGIPCKRFEAVTGVGMKITDSNVVQINLITRELHYDTVNDFFWHTGQEYTYTYSSENGTPGINTSGLELAYWTTKSGTAEFEQNCVITGLGFRSTNSNLHGIWYSLSDFFNQSY